MASFFKNLFRKEGDSQPVPAAPLTNDVPDQGRLPIPPVFPDSAGAAARGGLPEGSNGPFSAVSGRHMTARELAALLPPALLRFDGISPDQPVPLPAEPLRQSMQAGRPVLRLSQIREACPLLFLRAPREDEDAEVTLPLARVKGILEGAGAASENPFSGQVVPPALAPNPFSTMPPASPVAAASPFAVASPAGPSPFAAPAAHLPSLSPAPPTGPFGQEASPFAAAPGPGVSPFAPVAAASGFAPASPFAALSPAPPVVATPAPASFAEPFPSPFAPAPSLAVPSAPATQGSEPPREKVASPFAVIAPAHAVTAASTSIPAAPLKPSPFSPLAPLTPVASSMPSMPVAPAAPAAERMSPPAMRQFSPAAATSPAASGMPPLPAAAAPQFQSTPVQSAPAPAPLSWPPATQTGSVPLPILPRTNQSAGIRTAPVAAPAAAPASIPAVLPTIPTESLTASPQPLAAPLPAIAATAAVPAPPPPSEAPQAPVMVDLSLRAVLRDSDPAQLGFAPENVPESVRVSIPLELVSRQLATGRVEIGLEDVCAGISEKFRAAFARAARDLRIVVPMSEVFHNLPESARPALEPLASTDGHLAISTSPFQTPFAIRAEEDSNKQLLDLSATGFDMASRGPRPATFPVPSTDLPPILAQPGAGAPPAVHGELPPLRPPGAATPLENAGTPAFPSLPPRQGMLSRPPGSGTAPTPPRGTPRVKSGPIPTTLLRPFPKPALPADGPAEGLTGPPPLARPVTPTVLPALPGAMAPPAAIPPPLLGPPPLLNPPPLLSPPPLAHALPPLLPLPSKLPVSGVALPAPGPAKPPMDPSDDLGESFSAAELSAEPPPRAGSAPVALPAPASNFVPTGLPARAPLPDALLPSLNTGEVPAGSSGLTPPAPAGLPPSLPSPPTDLLPPLPVVAESPARTTPSLAPPPSLAALSAAEMAPEISPGTVPNPAPGIPMVEGEIQEAEIVPIPPVVDFSSSWAIKPPLPETAAKREESLAPEIQAPAFDPAVSSPVAPPVAPPVPALVTPSPVSSPIPSPSTSPIEDLTFGCISDIRQLTLRAVLGTDQALTPQDIVDRCAGLSGLKACVLLRQDSTLISHGMNEAEAAAFRASAVKTRDSLTTLAEVMGLGAGGNFTLRTDQGIRSFFLEPGLCLGVWHDQPAFSGGTREKLILITHELAKA